MALTRRTALGIGAGAALTATGCSKTTTTTAPAASDTGPVTLRLAWWGNETRNKNTNAMVEAFMKANPGITVKTEPGEWASYWDKLATQIAGNDAPDVFQMSINYVREYAGRNALIDLRAAGVPVDRFSPGSLDPGIVKDKLVAVNAGINAQIIIANPQVFQKAGVPMPDDKTWTWETYRDVAAAVTKSSPAGTYGSNTFWSSVDTMFNAWLRQRGKAYYTDTGLGFDSTDVVPWFEMMQSYIKAGAIPTPQISSEESTKPLEQQLLATGRAAMGLYNSNQVVALDAYTKQDCKILRGPSLRGPVNDKQAWVSAAMLWSISSKSKHQAAAAKLVSFLVNDLEANKIQLAERGLPPNSDVLAGVQDKLNPSDRKASAFLTSIQGELGKAPQIPLVGAATFPNVLGRYCDDVAFGRQQPAGAADKMIAEMKGMLK